jgi:uncharacterized membrane protein
MVILNIFLFYIAFSLCGFIGFPLTSWIIKNRFLAIASAKLVGLVIFGYFIWALSSLKILDYQNINLVWALFILFIAGGIAATWKLPITDNKNLQNNEKFQWFKDIVKVEILSLILYLAYLAVRSVNPSANNTEHFMDMAMLTASGKSHYFPFIDPWYAGKTVNYYYYGSYLTSLISNLSVSPYSLSYNFMLGLIYSQTALLTGILVWVVTKFKRLGILSAYLVTTAGTLFFASCFITSALNNSTCFYASSTRLYTPSYIINEIPSYSFTVGNLHAHLLALPFFVLGLVLIYSISIKVKPQFIDFAVIAICFATSGIINTWDLITLASLILILICVKVINLLLSQRREINTESISKWIGYSIGALAIAGALMSLYLIYFQSPVLGIGFSAFYVKLHSLTDIQYPTPILAQLGMWGIFLGGIIFAIIFRIKSFIKSNFIIALIIISIGILVGIELLFIKDIYSIANPSFFRANTTFKFGFHAWTMLSIAFSCSLAFFITHTLSKLQLLSKAFAYVLCFLAFFWGTLYPIAAIQQYYTPTSNTVFSLDSSLWMKQANTDDWKTVQFINQNIHERTIIAEAVLDSYTEGTRITSFSGMITPMGWPTHEWTWRFEGKEAEKLITDENPNPTNIETGYTPIAKVKEDIDILYNTNDPTQARQIIYKYGIQYIYVGELERNTYKDLDDKKFENFSVIIFKSNNSRLYKVR